MRSNQLILKEINLEYLLEGLKLKLQYFGHLMQRANSLEKNLTHWKRPDTGEDLGKKRKVQQKMKWLDNITNTTWCK